MDVYLLSGYCAYSGVKPKPALPEGNPKMNSDCILLQKNEQIVTITLNKPESLNALDFEMLERLEAILEDLRRDDEVGSVVLTGNGRGFCSGANLLGSTGQALSSGGLGVHHAVARINQILVAIAEMQKPWIAAVNGPAVGGGFSLAMTCDLVIAAQSAYFAVSYAKVGMVTDMGSTYLLPRLVGLRKAKELAFFGERISAEEALAMGLVNRVVPDEALMDSAQEWAEKLAAGATLALGAIKLGMQRALHATYRDTLHWEAMMLALIAQSEDAAEGLMAFFQKRKPKFKGK